ncbi:MAG: hypothetical protein A2046_11370, partial [Bacteroidetes bacterium GWA2_30_7]
MSGSEIIVIILVFLMLFGTKNLPAIARGLGKGMNELRKATEDIKKEINVNTDAIKKELNVNTEEITNLRDKIKKEIEENVNYQEDIKKGNAIKSETFSLKKPSYPNKPEDTSSNKSDSQNI